MGNIFVTEIRGVRSNYYYQGQLVSRETVKCLGYANGVLLSTREKTDEELAAVPGVTMEKVEYDYLASIFEAVHSGPPREAFLKEENGLAYFRCGFGDRPAGIDWRIPVLRVLGDMVILDHSHAESRRFSRSNSRLENGKWECDCRNTEWTPEPLNAGFRFG